MFTFLIRNFSTKIKENKISIENGLKKLYLKVHPDIFAKYGEEYKEINTKSIKVFK